LDSAKLRAKLGATTKEQEAIKKIFGMYGITAENFEVISKVLVAALGNTEVFEGLVRGFFDGNMMGV
jgi:hypothetical protein